MLSACASLSLSVVGDIVEYVARRAAEVIRFANMIEVVDTVVAVDAVELVGVVKEVGY
jgi:hypothetical protein